MAYVSYLHNGVPHVGEIVGDRLVPLSGLTELGTQTSLDLLRDAVRDTAASVARSAVILRPVVPSPPRIFCVGLNYHSHVDETKRELPTYPVLFPKFAGSLIGPDDEIVLPPESVQVDYEGELAVVIGRAGRRVARDAAADYVLGYTVANDVSMRDYQYKTHQWMQGKAWDNSTPIGPALVTPDEVDISRAFIRTVLDGQVVQDSDLSQLIFDIPTLVSTVSEFTRLLPGDIILTGTPGGVGYRRDPQLFLRPGSVVTVEIEGVGSMTNRCRAE
ncbi:hypothetical protein BH09ACT4_BH09ACT4_06080 [soil metagenome]